VLVGTYSTAHPHLVVWWCDWVTVHRVTVDGRHRQLDPLQETMGSRILILLRELMGVSRELDLTCYFDSALLVYFLIHGGRVRMGLTRFLFAVLSMICGNTAKTSLRPDSFLWLRRYINLLVNYFVVYFHTSLLVSSGQGILLFTAQPLLTSTDIDFRPCPLPYFDHSHSDCAWLVIWPLSPGIWPTMLYELLKKVKFQVSW